MRKGWRRQWPTADPFSERGKILRRQRHSTPSECRRGPEVVRRTEADDCNFVRHHFHAGDLRRWLILIRKKQDRNLRRGV